MFQAILIFFGREIYREAPPVPQEVVTTEGRVLMTAADIKDGQNIWQSLGGQEIGTVWGHGAYKAPDWTADWLHREALFILNRWSLDEFSIDYSSLDEERQAMLQKRLENEMRKNTYDPGTGKVTVSPVRGEAFEAISKHYSGLFMDDPSADHLRESYSIPPNSIKDQGRMEHAGT